MCGKICSICLCMCVCVRAGLGIQVSYKDTSKLKDDFLVS